MDGAFLLHLIANELVALVEEEHAELPFSANAIEVRQYSSTPEHEESIARFLISPRASRLAAACTTLVTGLREQFCTDAGARSAHADQSRALPVPPDPERSRTPAGVCFLGDVAYAYRAPHLWGSFIGSRLLHPGLI